MTDPGTCPECGPLHGAIEVCHTEPVGAAVLARTYRCTECKTEWDALFRFEDKEVV
jgi:DNA-directed RNA polymerase subunit RPC12/RpoP